MNEPANDSPIASYICIGLTCLSGFVLMGLRNPKIGWPLLAVTFVITLAWHHPIRRHLPLVIVSLALLGLTPITTNISIAHMLYMGAMIALAVTIPYLISSKIYHDRLIRFPLGLRGDGIELRWPTLPLRPPWLI